MSVVFDCGNKVCYKWTPKLTSELGDQRIKSGKFGISGDNALEFELSVLCVNKNFNRTLCTNISVEVLQRSCKRGRAVIKVSANGRFSKEVDLKDWKYPHIFEDVLPLSHFSGGCITIFCYIKWYDNFEELQIPGILNPSDDGFKLFYNNQTLSDVIIDMNGEELHAHIVILSAQSPVFLTMFTTDMKEAAENRVSIEDIDVNVMMIVLKYMYTGDTSLFKNDINVALNVLAAAEKYQIVTLKAACSIILYETLTPDNAMTILQEIDKYDVPKLYERIIIYISENKTKFIETPEDFKEICQKKSKWLYEFINLQFKFDDVVHMIMREESVLPDGTYMRIPLTPLL